MLSRDEARQPSGHMDRWLRAEHIGEGGEPFAHRCWLVIANIIDAASALDRRHGRVRRIVDVKERPPRAAVPDERHVAFANLVDEAGIEHPRVIAVERAVAERDAYDAWGICDRVFEIADCIERALQLLRRVRVE